MHLLLVKQSQKCHLCKRLDEITHLMKALWRKRLNKNEDLIVILLLLTHIYMTNIHQRVTHIYMTNIHQRVTHIYMTNIHQRVTHIYMTNIHQRVVMYMCVTC
jgi:hypothetical protein